MTGLISQLEQLEIKAKIYSDNYGPDSDEVKEIDRQMAEINAEILDFMCPE